MIDLTGRVALVTGGSRGIGRACALKLAQAGTDVIVNYVASRTAAMEVAEEIVALGRRASVVRADISEEDDVQSMIDFIREEHGQLDIIVSNAATGGFRPLLGARLTNFDAAMHTNAMALVYLTQAAMPLLEKCVACEDRSPLQSWSADRAPLVRPDRRFEGGRRGHRPALDAGGGQSRCERQHRQGGACGNGFHPAYPRRRTDAGRPYDKNHGRRALLTVDNVANAVVFLASPLSDMIQGETITVDGGAAIHI